MTRFLPYDNTSFYYTAILLIIQLGISYLFAKKITARWFVWLVTVSAVVLIERITKAEAPIFRMLAITTILFQSMKLLVVTETYKEEDMKLNVFQWAAFTLGWFGMRPKLFESLGNSSLAGGGKLVFGGIARILAGLMLVYIATVFTTDNKILISTFLLVGFSLILHFGILAVSAGIWRFFGVDTTLLFRSPLLSLSLNEFWAKRWNVAYSEMLSTAIMRPFKEHLNRRILMGIAFLFSGLLHELAISFPVNKGYGLPTLYFIIQAIGIALESVLKKNGMMVNKWICKCWVWIWVIAPTPLLFHLTFLEQIIWPIAGMIFTNN